MLALVIFAERPYDLPRVADAVGSRVGCAGHVDLPEAPAAVEEAVGGRAAAESPDVICPASLMP